MNQDHKVVSFKQPTLSSFKKLSDKNKLVASYHMLEDNNIESAKEVLSSINQRYFIIDLHRDLSRSLLCAITYKTTGSPEHGKESEFYLVVYRLTKKVLNDKLIFKNSGYIQELKQTLFRDFTL